MAAYVILLALLAVWAAVALRHERQVRFYSLIFGINVLLVNITEWLLAIVLDLYSFGGFTNYFLVTLGIGPLMGVLYVHYARHRPLFRAVVAAAILGGPVEAFFLQIGAFRYERGWHPLLTMAFFTVYFIWTRWLTSVIRSGRPPEPQPTSPGRA